MLTKRLILMLWVGFLVIMGQSVAAWEWDNVKTHTPPTGGKEYGTIEVINALGLGDTLAIYDLEENTNICFQKCHAKGTAILYSEDSLFQKIEFDNLVKNPYTISNQQFYLIETVYVEEEVLDYETQCKTNINGTYACKDIVVGSHTVLVLKDVEVPYNFETLPPGIYRWVLRANKGYYDAVDWKASALGLKFNEWAPFVPGQLAYNNQPVYKMDTAGNDSTGYVDLFNLDGVSNVTGKINGGFELDGSNITAFSSIFNIGTGDMAISWWMKSNNTDNTSAMSLFVGKNPYSLWVTTKSTACATLRGYEFQLGFVDNFCFNGYPSNYINVYNDSWHHVVFMRNSSYLYMFIDGTQIPATNGSLGLIETGAGTYTTFVIGGYLPTNADYQGALDEVYYWNRSLTFAEVTTLWNNGDGTQWDYLGLTPVVTLNTPAANYNSTSSAITFNCSATVSSGTVENITLNIDGTTNYTKIASGATISMETTQYLTDGFHYWNCSAKNSDNTAGSAANRYLGIDTVKPIINIATYNASLKSKTLPYHIQFNWTITDTTAVTSWIYNGTNTTAIGSGTTFGFNISANSFGANTYLIYANDSYGNINVTNVSVIMWYMNVTMNEPSANYTTQAAVFNCTANNTYYEISNISLYIGGELNYTEIGLSGLIASMETTQYLTDGTHQWNCSATDTANNEIRSGLRIFSIDSTIPNINVTDYDSTIIRFSLPTLNTTINWTGTDTNLFNGWVSYSGANYTANTDGAGNFGYNLSLTSDANQSAVLYVNDTFGNLNSSTIWIYVYYIVPYITETKNNPLEGESNIITLYVNLTNISVVSTNTSAYLVWNGTNKGRGTKTLIANNSYRFANNFTVPTGLGGLTTYYWNYSIQGIYNSTIEENQTIRIFTLSSDCGVDDNATVLNFSVYSEPGYTKFDAINFSSYFLVWLSDKSQNKTFNINKNVVQNWTICLHPNNTLYLIDMISEFNAEAYRLREYYLNNLTLNASPGNSQLVNLYVISNTLGTNIDLYTYNLQDEAYPNRYVYSERYDVSTGTYRLMAISKTDDNGHGVMPMELTEGLYRFIVKAYPNTVEFTSEPRKITSSTLILRIAGTAFSDILDTFEDISYSLTYNNATTTFRAEYTTDGTAIAMCLNVYKHTVSNHTRICQSCETSASGVLLCTIDNTTGTYFATLTAEINPLTLIDSISIAIEAIGTTFMAKFGTANSYFVSMMIIGTMTLTAIYSPVAALIMGLIGVIATIGLGLFSISGAALFVIAVAVIFIITRLKR